MPKSRLSNAEIKAGFDNVTVDLALDKIVPIKIITPAMRTSAKFDQIAASIREIGIIEPPVVSPDPQSKGRYILLDGHLRLEVLKSLDEKEVTCLVSTDDEAFTYNKHVSRLSIIQEHRMILKAVERGVPEDKIARALNVDVDNIVHKRNLLVGICPEVVELLKDKMVAAATFPILRKMKPLRQIEAATLMNDANIYSSTYAQALFAATPKDQLVNPAQPKKIKGLDDEKMARMESEMEGLQREFRLIDENYSTDVLNLTLAKGYLSSILGNAKVVRYLAHNHAEFLAEFQKVAEMSSLNEKLAA